MPLNHPERRGQSPRGGLVRAGLRVRIFAGPGGACMAHPAPGGTARPEGPLSGPKDPSSILADAFATGACMSGIPVASLVEP